MKGNTMKILNFLKQKLGYNPVALDIYGSVIVTNRIKWNVKLLYERI